MNLYDSVYDSLDWPNPAGRVVASLFVTGAGVGAFFALIHVFHGNVAWPFIVVYALLGASILSVAELASRLASSWWAKGLLMGVTGGVLAGLSAHALFAEDPLLVDLAAFVVGGVAGGMVHKYQEASSEKVDQNGIAACRR